METKKKVLKLGETLKEALCELLCVEDNLSKIESEVEDALKSVENTRDEIKAIAEFYKLDV